MNFYSFDISNTNILDINNIKYKIKALELIKK